MQKNYNIINSKNTVRPILNLKINDNDIIRCELKRYWSPRTIRTILALTPFKSNAIVTAKVIGLQTPVTVRIERPLKELKRGDVAFFPSEGKIYFFRKDVVAKRPLTPLGTILSGIENLDSTKPDDVFLCYGE